MARYIDKKKNNTILYAASLILVVALVLILYISGVFGGSTRTLRAEKLRCVSSQRVTPFGDRILYYDGITIFCLSSSGRELWKYSVGQSADFTVGENHVVAWIGSSLHIIDRNGNPTFNDQLSDDIQLVRAGKRYIAVVIGPSTNPSIMIKDMAGLSVGLNISSENRSVLIDVGFFNNDEYLWAISMDIYNVVPTYTMQSYQVGLKNTGDVILGEEIVYKVLYSGDMLNIINTRDIKLFNYRCESQPGAKRLVYGWQLSDYALSKGDARLLFVPVKQLADDQGITELRLLEGKKDLRYTLPDQCIGTGLNGNTLFAFSSDSLYRCGIHSQRFSALRLPAPITQPVTAYYGRLSNGVALIACGQEVFAVTLP